MHILAQLQVQSTKRLVEKKHLGMGDKSAGDSHSLLLTAGKSADALIFKARKSHHAEHLGDSLLYFFLGYLFQPERKSDVFVNVEMREERVLLEHRVYGSFIRRDVADLRSVKIEAALVGSLEASDDAESGCFTATGRTEEGDELSVSDVEIHGVDNLFSVVGF